jgi:hypothetical protein
VRGRRGDHRRLTPRPPPTLAGPPPDLTFQGGTGGLQGLGAMQRTVFLQKLFAARAMVDTLVEVMRPPAEA